MKLSQQTIETQTLFARIVKIMKQNPACRIVLNVYNGSVTLEYTPRENYKLSDIKDIDGVIVEEFIDPIDKQK